MPLAQQIWSHGREAQGLPGYTKDETHDVLVQVVAGCEDGPIPGTRVRMRTSEMDSTVFADYVRRCEELLYQQYQVTVPDDDWQAVQA